MAVSGKGPAPREVPYATLNDPPDAEAEGKAVAEALSRIATFNQGLLAARPVEAASKEGDIYYATNDLTYGPNGTVYLFMGGAWKVFPLPTVAAAMIAAEAVETGAIKGWAVTEAKHGEESVSTPKLKNLAVTAAKIAEGTITAAKMAAESIGTAALANLAVTAAKIAAEAIETTKIKTGAVTAPKLGLGTIRQEGEPAQSFLSWGLVSSAGVVLAGSGDYTVAKTGEGAYEIKWTKEKVPGTYAIVGSGISEGSLVVAWPENGKKAVIVTSLAKTEVKAPIEFNFIALAAS